MANSLISKRQAKKVRKQKIIAATFGAIFLILVVVQGPRTLKMFHSKPAASAPVISYTGQTSTTGTATAAAPTASPAAVTSVTVTASAKLRDSDRAPERTKSQLVSFDTFDSKDPFVQQVSETQTPTGTPTSDSSTASSGSSSGASAAPAPTPAKVVNVPAGDTTGSTASSTATPTRTTASVKSSSGSTRTLTSAVLEVNGQRQHIGVADSFPKANPTFKLVALADGSARIGIAGGNYASGAQTVAVRLGHTLTLVNTADGMRYALKLVSAR